ncbi:hypothetical protein [Ruegeria meonggei]|uniref:hypothetical protein n=1 Tax=Ruegeria meonggei TaxID=1446476 RepID=UPI00367163FC
MTCFCPADPNFNFGQFHDVMKDQGFIIYPGKLTNVESFRIGCIGRMDAMVMRAVVATAKQAQDQMQVTSAAPRSEAVADAWCRSLDLTI